MQISQRPAHIHRKGLTVLQKHQTSKRKKEGECKESCFEDIKSNSRSRGISMSRQTILKLDKIYDKMHFPDISKQTTQQTASLYN